MSYIFVIFYLLIIHLFLDYLRVYAVIASSAILILFAGLRYNTGSDYLAYFNIFQAVVPLSDAENLGLNYIFPVSIFVEPGYLYLISIFKSITKNFNLFLFTSSMMITPLYVRFFKVLSKENFVLLTLLYFSTTFMLFDMSGARQFFAFGFQCLSLTHLIRNQTKRMIIAFLLGSLFHISIFLLLPVLYYAKRDYPRWVFISLLMISWFVFILSSNSQLLGFVIDGLGFLFPDLLVLKLAAANDSDFVSSSRRINLTYIIYNIFIFVFITNKRFININHYIIMRNLSILYVIYVSVFAFSEDFSVRVSSYLHFAPLLIVLIIIQRIIADYSIRLIAIAFLSICFLRNIFFDERFIMYQPYESYLECILVRCDEHKVDKYNNLE